MADYSKITNFATKDTLPSGNSGKIVKGTEIDDEFNAISSAIASKANTASPAFTGTPTAPTALAGTNTTQLATTAFVTSALAALITVPSGLISLWSGASNAIPSGWLLCNGANGTPDLRDRFVVGAGSSYAVGATGGLVTATTSSSGGGATSATAITIPRDGWGTTGGAPDPGTAIQNGRLVVGSGATETVETLESLRAAGNDITISGHSHNISNHTHSIDTRSPYYALCYIMKA